MSTLKTINIVHPSGSPTNLVLGNDGSLTVANTATFSNTISVTGAATFSNTVTVTNNITAAGTVSMGSPFSNRNKIINGNFNFWQRGFGYSTGTPYFVNSPSHYSADRWCGMGYQQGRHFLVYDLNGFGTTGLSSINAMRVSSSTTSETAQGTRLALAQKIAYDECYNLQGKSITLSFWIKFSAATFTSVSNSGDSAFGDFRYGIYFNTTGSYNAATWTDSTPDSSTVLTIANGSLPTVWTKYTVTTTCPGSLRNISVRFGSTNCGSTAIADSLYYQITEVQLEEGNIATPYELKGYNEQLAQCQRYYEKSYNLNVPVGSQTTYGAVRLRAAAVDFWYYVQYKVTKRAATTAATVYSNRAANNPGYLYQVDGTGFPADRAVTTSSVSETGFHLYCSTIGATGALIEFQWTADAEL
jgi:hypothetical protein